VLLDGVAAVVVSSSSMGACVRVRVCACASRGGVWCSTPATPRKTACPAPTAQITWPWWRCRTGPLYRQRQSSA
jgi:hypothetical protein